MARLELKILMKIIGWGLLFEYILEKPLIIFYKNILQLLIFKIMFYIFL